MGPRLEGQVAVVTGGGSGIGRATCLALAREASHLIIVGRGPERLAETVDLIRPETDRHGTRAHALALDVRSEADMRVMAGRAAQWFGRADILVCSAGIARPAGAGLRTVAQTPAADFDQVIATNLTGLFLSNRAVLPLMIPQGRGDILNLSSTAGLAGLPFDGPYCASKAGAIGLSEALAGEVGPLGVRVQVLVPGPFETEMWSRGGSRLRPGGQIPPASRVADAAVYLLTLPRDVRMVAPVVKPLDLPTGGTLLGGFGSAKPAEAGPTDARARRGVERPPGPPEDPGRLKGKVVIVTGGPEGLGREVCRLAAGEGAAVVVAGLDRARVDEAVAGLPTPAGTAAGHLGFTGDVRDEAGHQDLVSAALERFGRLDALVTCAAAPRRPETSLAQTTTADWDLTLGTELRGVFLSNRAVLPAMTRQRSGIILNVSPAPGPDGVGPSCATGAGVRGLSQSIAEEVRGFGVKVQAVSPCGAEGPRAAGVAALILFMLTQPEDAVLVGPGLAPPGSFS